MAIFDRFPWGARKKKTAAVEQEKRQPIESVSVPIGERRYERSVETKYGKAALMSRIGVLHEVEGNVNQDNGAIIRISNSDRVVLAAADGMGGHAKAETASHTAVESIIDSEMKKRGMEQSLDDAHAAVMEVTSATEKKPSTTVVCAEIENNQVRFHWAGDSLGMIIRDNKINYITLPQSYKQRDGVNNNNIYSMIGYRESNYEPRSSDWMQLQKGDKIMVVTDGLTRRFRLEKIPINDNGEINYTQLNKKVSYFLSMFSDDKHALELAKKLDARLKYIEGDYDDLTMCILKVDNIIENE